jgi:hypothetical protein
MNFCCVLLLIVLIIITIVLIILLLKNTKEKFTQEKNIPPEEARPIGLWIQRWKELNSINPVMYKHYFSPIIINDWSNVKHQPNTIFISIASYRDNQCIDTLKNIAQMADNPENLHFVICQQNSVLEKDCLKWCQYDKDHPACKVSITKIERLSHYDARGPTYARWRIQQLWTGEEFFLQIDAHTRMIKGWDTILKNQLLLCPADKPILTQYPLEYDIVEEKSRGDPIKEKWQLDKLRNGIYVKKFENPDGFTRIQSDYTTAITRRPFKSTAWAAGFSFSKGSLIIEAGYDPYTPFLFFGEEMDITIRAFTHGWDFYSPSVTVIFHNYKRDHRNTFWEKIDQKPLEILSRFRVYKRLGYINDIPDKYKFILIGMENWPIGNERTIEEYEKMAKINIKNELVIV